MEDLDSDQQTEASAVQGATLYVVATPIGNLADLTDRARQVLAEVDVVAAEDTRHTGQLLAGIRKKGGLHAYHDFSKQPRIDKLVARLQAGESVALVSDAGTPLISDPGFRLVRLVRESGIPVLPVPGASALTAAISVAGLPTDRFTFEGFLPAKNKARTDSLMALQSETRTLIFYESPRRVTASLESMREVFGPERLVFVARELTKKFEEHFLGSLQQCCEWIVAGEHRRKGEFVLVLAGADQESLDRHTHQQAMSLVRELQPFMPLKKAVTLASRFTGARKNDIYAAAIEEFGTSKDV